MMIKPNEFRTLVDYYKGKISVKKEEPKPKKKRKQTEVKRLKEFGSWEPWEKRGYDPYQAFQDDEDEYAPSTS